MKKYLLYWITFVVAFCSISYELILGQTMSVFLGDTVLRYSVTVGIYLFAMGVGAMVAEGRFVKKFIANFALAELALTLLGGFAVAMFFLLNLALGTGALFFLAVHFLIFAIGVLTGFEIPLLISAQRSITKENQALILGIDYFGAFFGSLIFAFVFYPKIGIVPAAFFVGFLNSLAGILFFFIFAGKRKTQGRYFWCLVAMAFVMAFFLAKHGDMGEFLIKGYLKQ